MVDNIKILINKHRTTKDTKYLLLLFNLYEKYHNIILPRCKVTGGHIYWYDTRFSWYNNTLNIKGKSSYSNKIVNGNKYYLTVSEHGLFIKFGDDFSRINKHRLFNTINKLTKISFGINNIDAKAQNKKCAITLDNMISKYGVEIGTDKYNAYCEKQRLVNTFEYKEKHHNMTKNDFNKFNKSRAITLDNMISKYGVEIGTDKYNAYCEKQRITSTDKYIRNKFGEEYLTKVKDAKSHNFNYYLRLSNGDVEVAKELHKKYHEQRINNIGSISKNSLHLFNTIINKFNILSDSYYGENEFGLYDKEFKRYYKYDFTSTKYKFIIEFNGDVFHGNPKIYNETDRPNFFNTKKTCSEIWAYDKQKINLAKEHGFDVFVVWESEFNNEYIELVNRLFNTIKHKIK